jgi:hypothetical protein
MGQKEWWGFRQRLRQLPRREEENCGLKGRMRSQAVSMPGDKFSGARIRESLLSQTEHQPDESWPRCLRSLAPFLAGRRVFSPSSI